jgi:hypothetical protein
MRRVVLLLTFVVGAAAQDVKGTDWRFAPPDANFFCGIDAASFGALFEGLQIPKASLGFLRRLERVSFAIRMAESEPEGVAMLEGDFTASDLGEIRKSLEGQPREDVAVIPLDPRHVLVGDRAAVESAQGRLKRGESGGVPRLLSEAAPALGTGDFWMIGKLPKDMNRVLALARPATAKLNARPPRKTAIVYGMERGPVELPVR